MPQVAPKIVLWGGCETNSIAVYLNAYTPKLEVYGNHMAGGCFMRVNSVVHVLSALRNDPAEIAGDVQALDLAMDMMVCDIFSGAEPGTVFIFNFGMDPFPTPYLRHKTNGMSLNMEPRMWGGCNVLEITEAELVEHMDGSHFYQPDQRDHVLRAFHYMREHFETVAPPDEAARVQMVRDLIARLPAGCRMVIAVDPEAYRPEPEIVQPLPLVTRWMGVMQALAAEYDNVEVVTFSEVLRGEHEIQLHGNHVDREVYLRFAERVVERIGLPQADPPTDRAPEAEPVAPVGIARIEAPTPGLLSKVRSMFLPARAAKNLSRTG